MRLSRIPIATHCAERAEETGGGVDSSGSGGTGEGGGGSTTAGGSGGAGGLALSTGWQLGQRRFFRQQLTQEGSFFFESVHFFAQAFNFRLERGQAASLRQCRALFPFDP